ncbi:MAG: hypothetical protein ACI4NP_06465 [Thermoguttaceae bacterium]
MTWGLESERSTLELVVSCATFLLAFVLLASSFESRRRRIENLGKARAFVVLALRFLWLATLLFLYLEPTATRRIERPGAIATLLDDSASMTRPGKEGVVPINLAEELEESAALFAQTSRAPYAVTRLSERDPYAGKNVSPLLDALHEVPGRVFLFSDGIVNPDVKYADYDGERAAKVDVVLLGDAHESFNWRLENLQVARPVEKGDDAALNAQISLEGADRSRDARVELWNRVDDRVSTLIDAQSLTLDPESTVDYHASWNPQKEKTRGPYLLVVRDQSDAAQGDFESIRRSPPLQSDEFCTEDNAESFVITPNGKKTRVLLVDEFPRFEYRYLRETLRWLENIELKTTLLKADPESLSADPYNLSVDSLDRNALSRFDLIILGDLSPEALQGNLERIVDVVEKKGSKTSLWFVGPNRLARDPRWPLSPFARLAPGPPITPSQPDPRDSLCQDEFAVEPTVFAMRLYPFLDLREPAVLNYCFSAIEESGAAQVLLKARPLTNDSEPIPLLAVSSLGTNAVAWQGTDELWRLQTLEDKTVYRRFLLATIDYLCDPARREVALNASPNDSLDSGLKDPYAYYAPETSERILAAKEKRRTAATRSLLEKYAAASGGRVLDLRNIAKERALQEGKDFLQERIRDLESEEIVEKTPLLPRNALYPLAFALFILLFFL